MAGKKAQQNIFKVTFYNQGEVYEIFARKLGQGGLFGFVEIEELVFGEKTKVVIDPSQERLEREFEGVKRAYLPLHAIIRIDEVQKGGTGRITTAKDTDGKIMPFPAILPRGDQSKKP